MRHGAVLCAVVQIATLDDEIRDFWRTIVTRFVDASRARIERESDVDPHGSRCSLVPPSVLPAMPT